MEFKDKVAIITGAASGMGLLAAKMLVEQGAKVVLTDINKEAVEKAAADISRSEGDTLGLEVDVREYSQVEQATETTVEKFGRIDILLNVAGGAETRMCKCQKPFTELPLEVIDWGLDVNLRCTIYFCRTVIEKMVEQKSGVIINLGSVTGVLGSAGAVIYSAAKSGIIGLTKALALTGAPHGVRACCVSPGPVLTRPDMAKLQTPLGRAAEPVEVVDFILYLCSDKAAFITGSNHMIDGGRICGGK